MMLTVVSPVSLGTRPKSFNAIRDVIIEQTWSTGRVSSCTTGSCPAGSSLLTLINQLVRAKQVLTNSTYNIFTESLFRVVFKVSTRVLIRYKRGPPSLASIAIFFYKDVCHFIFSRLIIGLFFLANNELTHV